MTAGNARYALVLREEIVERWQAAAAARGIPLEQLVVEAVETALAAWQAGDPDRRRLNSSILDATQTTREEHEPWDRASTRSVDRGEEVPD